MNVSLQVANSFPILQILLRLYSFWANPNGGPSWKTTISYRLYVRGNKLLRTEKSHAMKTDFMFIYFYIDEISVFLFAITQSFQMYLGIGSCAFQSISHWYIMVCSAKIGCRFARLASHQQRWFRRHSVFAGVIFFSWESFTRDRRAFYRAAKLFPAIRHLFSAFSFRRLSFYLDFIYLGWITAIIIQGINCRV